MRDAGILDKVDDYQYRESVFVRGNLHRYAADLESYFRRDSHSLMEYLANLNKDLERIADHVELYEKDPFGFELQQGGRLKCECPFPITQENAQEGIEWFESRKEFYRALLKSQKINHSTLREILDDPRRISSLDLTNYGHDNSIIRIQHAVTEEPVIRMRIFSNGIARSNPFSYYDKKSLGEGFCVHANQIDGVQADVTDERIVKPDLKTLRSFIESGEVKRSKLRVSPLDSEIRTIGDKVRYTIHLGKAELEMLDHLEQEECESYISSNNSEKLCRDSPIWSPEQGWKILRNLYGVLSIYDQDYKGGGAYHLFTIPRENSEAVKRAKADGGDFVKTIKRESLPALEVVFNRTLELKKQYGWNFYPRFSVTEVSNKSGLSQERVRKSLTNLTGVLCKVCMPHYFYKKLKTGREYGVHCSISKWFLPKTGLTLAYQMLESEGLTM